MRWNSINNKTEVIRAIVCEVIRAITCDWSPSLLRGPWWCTDQDRRRQRHAHLELQHPCAKPATRNPNSTLPARAKHTGRHAGVGFWGGSAPARSVNAPTKPQIPRPCGVQFANTGRQSAGGSWRPRIGVEGKNWSRRHRTMATNPRSPPPATADHP